jgi:mannose-1-phosphate guanylyltransferase/mannose-6-phosphate isomerase
VKQAAVQEPLTFATLPEADGWIGRWLGDHALPLWWRVGGDHEAGGFHEGITAAGSAHRAPRRARVQARQMFSYAVAAQLGWTDTGEAPVRHGWSFFQRRFARSDGLYRTRLTADGSPDDERAFIYDQAFALLGMAAARGLAPDVIDSLAAHQRLAAALETRRHWAGGYVEEGPQSFQANPHMHLLEACIAWMELGDTPLAPIGHEIVGLLKARFFDDRIGALREFFDADWRPAAGEDGRLVEPGHQFEWAWLCVRWSALTGDAEVRVLAEALFQAGLRGVDNRGVVLDELWDDFSVRSGGARLWPQTEYLRAALALGHSEHALRAAGTLRRYLDAPLSGAWFDRLRPDDSFVGEPSPASSLYHIVGAARELHAKAVISGIAPPK